MPLVRAATELVSRLSEYPVLDEEDWASCERDRAAEVWESFSLRDRIEVCDRFQVSLFAARRNEVPEDPQGTLVVYLAS
mgnify:FL=1